MPRRKRQKTSAPIEQWCPNEGCQYHGDSLTRHIPKCPFGDVRGIRASMTSANCNDDFQLPEDTLDVRHANVLFTNWQADAKVNPDREAFPTMNASNAARAMTMQTFISQGSCISEEAPSQNIERARDNNSPADVDFDFEPAYDDGMRRDRDSEQIINNQINEGHFNRNLASLSSRIRYNDILALRACTLSAIMKYRGTPLSLFDDIMNVIEYFALERNVDFQNRAIYHGRRQLLRQLKQIHGMQNFQAKIVNVPISKGRVAGVVVFDTMEVINHFLSDKRLFCKTNIAKGYDFWTGKTTESDVYGEVHTGTKWKKARDH